MLKMENVKKFYGRFCALDGLDLNIEDGALYGFVGPNGAGKTTAIRIMAGILYPDEGTVTIDDMESGTDNRRLKRRIGYVPDQFGVYSNLKVCEYMEFYAACCGLTGLKARKRIEKLLGYVELSDRQEFFVDALSRGMKQKLSLARALLHDPKILILDEPTSGLDPRTRYEFKQIIGELSDRGKTILISSHILSDISELCTDIGIIDQGRIVMSGRLREVMKMVTEQNPIVISMAAKITEAIRLLKADPRVKSLAIRGSDLMINYSGSQKKEAELLRKLVEAGLPVRSFSREKGSLEAIFMQLTGHGEERTILSWDESADGETY